jgi:hypothetical protein
MELAPSKHWNSYRSASLGKLAFWRALAAVCPTDTDYSMSILLSSPHGPKRSMRGWKIAAWKWRGSLCDQYGDKLRESRSEIGTIKPGQPLGPSGYSTAIYTCHS